MRRFVVIGAALLLVACEPGSSFRAPDEAEAYKGAALMPLGSTQDIDGIRKVIMGKDDDFRTITIRWISASDVIVFAIKNDPYVHYYCAVKKEQGRWHCNTIYVANVDG